jgi:hypothetical protein
MKTIKADVVMIELDSKSIGHITKESQTLQEAG